MFISGDMVTATDDLIAEDHLSEEMRTFSIVTGERGIILGPMGLTEGWSGKLEHLFYVMWFKGCCPTLERYMQLVQHA